MENQNKTKFKHLQLQMQNHQPKAKDQTFQNFELKPNKEIEVKLLVRDC
jgi:hypothetical protein